MITAGIVSEYNPLHNGHVYHIKKTKEKLKADCVIAVMSGNFTQRGEPAIIDKWTRTKIALLNGIDLVIELPVVFAISSAEYFARASVSILNSLKNVNYISFGSENGEINELNHIASLLEEQPEIFKKYLKTYLNTGVSFPEARQLTVNHLGFNGKILEKPNNILAIEYLKALKHLKSDIKPFTISRKGQGYNDCNYSSNLCSASSIRKYIIENYPDIDNIMHMMPESAAIILKDQMKHYGYPMLPEKYENIVIARIRSMSVDELRAYPYVSEGLENRILRAAKEASTYKELLNLCKTKRHPESKIRRIICNILLNIKKEDFLSITKNGPQYIRVLGFNEIGKEFLSNIKKKVNLPIITKSGNDGLKTDLASKIFEIESKASDIYSLCYNNADKNISGLEQTTKIIIV